jgi:dipeptidyl aminopeptidase/acylaminoacyl peptidase
MGQRPHPLNGPAGLAFFRRLAKGGLAAIALAFSLAACQAGPPVSSSTATAARTRTPRPSATPPPTATLTVDRAIQPYTIEGLRAHAYRSGEVHVFGKIAETDIYTRYLIDYPSDGLTITGIMQVPAEGQPPFPVIVMNHGFFARSIYHSGDGSDRAAEYLNKHGYLTLSSDYRSWGGSQEGPSLYYSGLVIDVINLLNAIPSIPQADPGRVGMWGHSMGGGVTIKVLEADPQTGGSASPRIKAAVFYSTVSADDADIFGRWGLGCLGEVAAGELQIGCNSSDVVPLDLAPDVREAYYDASTDPVLMQRIAAIHHLDLIATPIQINYGTKDGKTSAGTPPEWSQKLYQALLEAGKDAQLFAYDGEFHSFNGDAWLAFMERSARFYDQYVKNTP